jgi:inhibitor of KinA
MSHFKINYFQYSSNSILISWPNSIDKYTLKDVLLFKYSIEKRIKPLVEVISAYCSLLVVYDFTIDNIYSCISALEVCYNKKNNFLLKKNYVWKIPVCYEDQFAIDINLIMNYSKLSKNEIINTHKNNDYLVYFMGFIPNFMYLGGLDKKIHFKRKSIPSQKVPKGSVAIGGSQTGIYPLDSPGGWNVIGNSPIKLAGIDNWRIPISPGDCIRFFSIDSKEHKKILNSNIDYCIEREVIDD